MYTIIWNIQFKTKGKTYNLETVASIDIECSVDNLADTATITLPEAVMNQVLNIGDQVSRGSEVVIKAGYDNTLQTEFVGFVQDVVTNDSSLKILCEDALFLFRVGVKNVELKPTTVSKIAQTIIDQIDPTFKLVCDYDISYEKFVIHQATGYDVLKKLAEETKANIYFNTDRKELHIHAPYVEKGGEVIYSMQHNIEKSSLEYKKAIDRKVEVTVESTNIKGKVESYTTGTTGGEKVTLKVGSVSLGDLPKIANAELLRRSADMYEGSIDTWLIPFVQPTYTAKIKDEDYPEKDGKYYVMGVTTAINEGGGKRTVKIGIKVSV
jgi:phage protein D